MRTPRLATSIILVLVVASCSTGASMSPSTSAPVSVAPSTAGPGARIAVTLTDAFRMEPSQINVPLGRPVTFVVTNAGIAEHEFYVGDEAAQARHETEMGSMGGMGGMTHDDANGVALRAGETKELTMTFPTAGSTVAGCHVTGHYPAGMKAMITIGL